MRQNHLSSEVKVETTNLESRTIQYNPTEYMDTTQRNSPLITRLKWVKDYNPIKDSDHLVTTSDKSQPETGLIGRKNVETAVKHELR